MRMRMKPLIASILLLTAIGCASLPAKQRGLTNLQSTETAIEHAQAFEKDNYQLLGEDAVASNKLRSYCPPSALPEPLPQGATVHQVVSCLFAQAYTFEIAGTAALVAMKPGDTPPSVIGQLRGVVDTIFDILNGLAATDKQKQMVQLAQALVDNVMTVVQAFGGNVPSVAPGGVQ